MSTIQVLIVRQIHAPSMYKIMVQLDVSGNGAYTTVDWGYAENLREAKAMAEKVIANYSDGWNKVIY